MTAVLAGPAFAQSPIVIVSPIPGEFVDARVPFTVRWESPDIRRNVGFFVYYVHDSQRHAICEAAPTARECVWPDPPAPADFSGTLFVEARANNGTAIAVTQSEPFTLHEGFLPNAWIGNVDVGDVGVPGSVERNADDSVIVIRGSGTGLDGTADAFHLLFTQIVGGDAFNILGTITAIDGPPGTKVGLTLRSGHHAASQHDSVAVGQDDVTYVRRFDEAGPTVRTMLGSRGPLPIPIELMNRGEYTELNVMLDGVWRRAGKSILGPSTIGFGIASGARDVLATATIENVRSDTESFPAISNLSPRGAEFIAGTPIPIDWVQREPHPITLSYSLDRGESWTPIPECTAVLANSCVWNNPAESEAALIRADYDNTDDRTAWTASFSFAIRPGTLHPLPSGWTNRDVGDVAAPGFATYTSEHRLFAVAGSGAGISGAADEFHFVSQPVVEQRGRDVEIIARVASTEAFGPSQPQVGLMVRAHGGAGAAHVSVLVPTSAFSGVSGLTFVRRRAERGATIATLGPAVADPAWIRFLISNGVVSAYYREASNAPWRFLGSDRVALGGRYEAGLAVTAGDDGALGRGTFDNVMVTSIRR
jgi:hypothetical protein